MSAALSDCYQLLEISDYLGCASLVSKPIEVALMKHGQGLFRAIQVAPSAWVKIAYRIKSELIFRECFIHLVGNWKTLKDQPSVGEHIHEIPQLRALIETYHTALLQKCKDIEHAVMAHYPLSMRLPVNDIPIKREAYARDILVWMALTFYRHWVSQRLIMDKGRHGDDCGYQLIKQIGTADEAYLDKSVTNQFHTKFPMTKKAMNVVENHILELKECMKRIVQGYNILNCNCLLDTNRFPVGYFTCTQLKRGDYPWLNTEVMPRAVPAKREYKPGGNDIARQNLDKARMFQERSLSVEHWDDREDREGAFEGESDMDDVPANPTSKRARFG